MKALQLPGAPTQHPVMKQRTLCTFAWTKSDRQPALQQGWLTSHLLSELIATEQGLYPNNEFKYQEGAGGGRFCFGEGLSVAKRPVELKPRSAL